MNCIYSECLVERIGSLSQYFVETTIPDLAKGILQTAVFTPLSIATLGLSENINKNAGVTHNTNWLSKVTPGLLHGVFKVLNKDLYQSHIIFLEPPFNKSYSKAKNFWGRHVISRLDVLTTLVKFVAIAIIGLVPGSFALIAAIATRGKNIDINDLAIKLFNPLGIVSCICRGVRGIINPFQFEESYYFKSSGQNRAF